jgi:glycosyltransferase 2 family protein
LVVSKELVSEERIVDLSVCAAPEAPETTEPAASGRQLPLNLKISDSTKLRLKLLISLVLFASLFLFGKVDLSESWSAALQANRWYLSLAVVVYLSTVLINGHRWGLLAAAVGLHKSFWRLTQLCYVGLFFNLFLPSTVGGDFTRCYYLSKGTGKYANAFYSVIADRATGIAVLFLLATLGIVIGPGGFGLPVQLKWPIYAGTLAVFCVLPLAPKLSRIILGERNWITRQFNDSPASIYWKDKKLMLTCLLWSVVLQLIMVGVHILLGMALGLTQIPLWYYFVFYPCVAVLGFITPSFNGIGIREWAYTYFLTMMGADRAHALTYAIMWLGLTTLISVVGGIVYVAGHFKVPPKQVEEIPTEAM